MVWEPINFQRLADFDAKVAERFSGYLDEQERTLVESLTLLCSDSTNNSVLLSSSFSLLKEAERNILQLFQEKKKRLEMQPLLFDAFLSEVENIFHQQLFFLDNCIKELFITTEAIPIEKQGKATVEVVESLKQLIDGYMNHLLVLIHSIDKVLGEENDDKWRWHQLLLKKWRPRLLNHAIVDSLKKSEQFFTANYKKTFAQLEAYAFLKEKALEQREVWEQFSIFQGRDYEAQQCLKALYLTLKIFEINNEVKRVSDSELVAILKLDYSSNQLEAALKEYLQGLKAVLYEWGRTFKREGNIFFTNLFGRPKIKEQLEAYRKELAGLMELLEKCYAFFSAGNQPPASLKNISELIKEAHQCDNNYGQMIRSLERATPLAKGEAVEIVRDKVEKMVRAMSQPLASREIQSLCIDKLLIYIEQLEELSSFDQSVVDYIDWFFNITLRMDWKYHLLPQNPRFKTLYEIHHEFIKPSQDKAHIKRLGHFFEIIEEIEKWVAAKEEHQHIKEIEADIGELKGYLQGILAHLQREIRRYEEQELPDQNSDEIISEARRQLLEYRYLFAQFFYRLQLLGGDYLLRRQLLFIDDYFESVEMHLYSLQNSQKNKKSDR